MPEDEQEIYNGLMEQSLTNVSNILEQVKKKIIIGYAK